MSFQDIQKLHELCSAGGLKRSCVSSRAPREVRFPVTTPP